jgi:sugar/nucleoside kinase (ribokinase family)
MTGCVGGSDALGEFARAQLQAAGVDVVGPGPTSNATGVVMVFTTPDAQRSFLSSFSSEDSLHMSQQLQDAAASARLLLIEGYMWETQGAAEAIPALVRHARSVGTLVALTAGDVGVVERHGAKVRGLEGFIVELGWLADAVLWRCMTAADDGVRPCEVSAEREVGLAFLAPAMDASLSDVSCDSACAALSAGGGGDRCWR